MEQFNVNSLGGHKLFKNLPNKAPLKNKKCYSLVECSSDRIYVWDTDKCFLESVDLKPILRGESSSSMLLMNPRPIILFDVTSILLNRSSTQIALFGASGVAVVDLPRNSEDADGFVDVRCISLSTREFLNFNCRVRQCKWHVGSALGNHLMVLTSDEYLRMYNTVTGSVLWSCYLAKHTMKNSINTIALGETPVDFDFVLYEEEEKDESSQWPVLILYGNGEVGLLQTVVKEANHKLHVSGPLRMLPEADDNYGVDASSILVLRTSPPVVVLSTCTGTLYHGLLLPSDEADNKKDPVKALYFVESYELELGFIFGSDEEEDVVSCPIRLEGDPIEKSRYLCIHNAGIHILNLPLVSHISKYSNIGEEEFGPFNEGSDAQYILCTGFISKTGVENSPILGLSHVHLDSYLVILHNWKPVVVEVPVYEGQSTLLAAHSPHRSNFAYIVQKRLMETAAFKPPLFSLPSSAGAKEMHELVLKIIKQYRTLFAYYKSVAYLINEKVEKLRLSCESQLCIVNRLASQKNLLIRDAETIAELYEEANDKQCDIIFRVQNVVVNIRGDTNGLRTEEKLLQTLLENSEARREQYTTEINRLQFFFDDVLKEVQSQRNRSHNITEAKGKVLRSCFDKLKHEISDVSEIVDELKVIFL